MSHQPLSVVSAVRVKQLFLQALESLQLLELAVLLLTNHSYELRANRQVHLLQGWNPVGI